MEQLALILLLGVGSSVQVSGSSYIESGSYVKSCHLQYLEVHALVNYVIMDNMHE